MDFSKILSGINRELINFLSRLWNNRLLISSYIISFIVFYLFIVECNSRFKIFSEQEIPSVYFHLAIALVLSVAFVEIIIFIRNLIRKRNIWKNLTAEEERFIYYYIDEKTKTRYVTMLNGTYTDSGIINPLIQKKILYIASNMSEYRGEALDDAKQQIPINIHDDAFLFFGKVRLKASDELRR